MKTRSVLQVSVFALLAACGSDKPAQGPASAEHVSPETDNKLHAALADTKRPDTERVRDLARHPIETLAFFGLKDDMHVVELWPGAGWYTAVLAPVLREKGKLTITSYDPNGPPEQYETRSAKKLKERLGTVPGLFDKVEVKIVKPPTEIDLGPAGSADMVLTFRNFHNWMEDGSDAAILAAAFKVLKPGGIFGVEEHRAKAGTDVETSKKTGYVDEALLIAEVKKAGFVLDAKSEVNANQRDTKDYPEGVWTLPPTLALKDKDKAKYEAIGESDRMTLRFSKPEKK